MSRRFTVALPVSLLLSLLHVGCCVLPLVVSSLGSFSAFYVLGKYKSVFTLFQIGLLVYLTTTLVRHFKSERRWHFSFEKWTLVASFMVALAALIFGILEPLQTEEQQMARQRYEYFRNHGQLHFRLTGKNDTESLLADLKTLEGVKPATVKMTGNAVSATFRRDRTSEKQVFTVLRAMGYEIDHSE